MSRKEPNIVNGFNFDHLPIKAQLVGKAVDNSDGKPWEHYLWNITISYKSGFWTFPYKCGLAHIELKPGAVPMPRPPYRKGTLAYEHWQSLNMRPARPKNSDVMYSILSDIQAANQSFNDWCSDYGFDNDSMKAFKTYQTCCEYAVFVRKAFTAEQIQQMQKAFEE